MEALDEDCDLVLIHDGARPYVSESLIKRVIKGTEKYGACVPVLPLVDNILYAGDEGVSPLDRTPYRRVQTPVGFARERVETA